MEGQRGPDLLSHGTHLDGAVSLGLDLIALRGRGRGGTAATAAAPAALFNAGSGAAAAAVTRALEDNDACADAGRRRDRVPTVLTVLRTGASGIASAASSAPCLRRLPAWREFA